MDREPLDIQTYRIPPYPQVAHHLTAFQYARCIRAAEYALHMRRWDDCKPIKLPVPFSTQPRPSQGG